jgi:hypothetical protein
MFCKVFTLKKNSNKQRVQFVFNCYLLFKTIKNFLFK